MVQTIQALSWVFDSILVIIAFVLGVFLYKWISEKKVGDASALKDTGRSFKERYQESPWAKKASVWGP